MGYDAIQAMVRHSAGRLKISGLHFTLRLWCCGHRRPRVLTLGICARVGRVEREHAPVRRHSLGKEMSSIENTFCGATVAPVEMFPYEIYTRQLGSYVGDIFGKGIEVFKGKICS